MSHAVDLELLDLVVARMSAFEATLTDRLAELDAEVTALHGTWDGAAAISHQQAHARWSAGAAQVHAALVDMRRAARLAHDNYTAAMTANAAMFKGLM